VTREPGPAGPGDLASGRPDATSSRRRKPCPTCGNSPPKPKRPRASTSNEDYRAGLLRFVNGYLARIEEGGVDPLADAVAIRAALDAVIDAGVEICRGEAWSASWAEIAEATGLSRSAAAERWARFEGARRPGGQPANLR
jgi:hypothetical protein